MKSMATNDDYGKWYYEAGRSLGSLHGRLDDKRISVGQIMVMQAPADELGSPLIKRIVTRIKEMPEAEVDAFLAMYCLDRVVNR